MAALLICAVVLVLLLITYKAALPRPIPGIPHNARGYKSILGDVREILASAQETGGTFNWLAAQCTLLKSPIVQVFARPFCSPWVIITDFQESQDILLRRGHEFDRSSFIADMLDGVVPHHHISKLTSDPAFSSNRNLIKDLMTPSFISKTTAPHIYASVASLVELWKIKGRKANGRSFSATADIFYTSFDVIFSTTFGKRKGLSALGPQIELCNRQDPHPSIASAVSVEFETAPLPEQFDALHRLSSSVELAVKSPFPRETHWILRQFPSMRRAMKIRRNMLQEEIEYAAASFNPNMERQSTCALEEVVWREYSSSLKENRAPLYDSPAIHDELFGFLIAGLDTTATSMCWALKYLADHARVQDKLRQALRQAYPEALLESRMPTCDEISRSPNTYLDCVLEEIFRLMPTTSGIPRQAMCDTNILGHNIPRGTNVFLMTNGPSFWEPTMPIPDSQRQKSFLDAKLQVPEWTQHNMHEFIPERWLGERNGQEVCNPLAGPTMSFGLGARGCYGRRMACLKLRVMVALIVWIFVLERNPAELSSYNLVEGLTVQAQQCYVKLSPVA